MTRHGSPLPLLDLSAKIVAQHIPFQSIEHRYEHIPQPVQRSIIFWSFPRHEDDIKMYSSLSSDTFNSNAPTRNSNHNTSNLSTNNNNQTSPTSSNGTNNSTSTNGTGHNHLQGQGSVSVPAIQQQGPAWLEAGAGANRHGNQNQQQAPNSININSNNAPSSSSSKNNHNSTKQLTFHRGMSLFNEGAVHDVLQIGFNLSGLVSIKAAIVNPTNQPNNKIRGNNHNYGNNSNNLNAPNVQNLHHDHHHHHHNHHLNNQAPANLPNDVQNHNNGSNNISSSNSNNNNDPNNLKSFRVSVTFDRCKITSVSCSCELQDIFWCEHVVALILYRIRNPETIDLRVPISETLSSLDRQQLQKLVQYIIAEHHTEVLPTAQRLLDEMRQSYSEINQIQGAPDPTAGACADDEHVWHLDEQQLNEKVQNYLNSVCSNSKEAVKQINALFEKIREMFRAKDSNGTRLLKLITEQFLIYATRNEKSRSLWDQLVSLWVVVMLNPDATKPDRDHFAQQLIRWSKVIKCPKEDVERRTSIKRKAADLSDDEDQDDYGSLSTLPFSSDCPLSFSQSNNYPAHMATHRLRSFPPSSAFPILRQYNQLPLLQTSQCPCQASYSIAKKMRTNLSQPNNLDYFSCSNQLVGSGGVSSSSSSSSSSSGGSVNNNTSNLSRPSSSSNLNSYPHHHNHLHHNHHHHHRSQPTAAEQPANANELQPVEPKSVFQRALEFRDSGWNDSHLKLILNRDGPISHDIARKSNLFDFTGNPLWFESISMAAARIETLRSHGYREQALRLTVATVRNLKLQQDQWCIAVSDPNSESPCLSKEFDIYNESWIGHPFDPINVMVDILLNASLADANNNSINDTSNTNSNMISNTINTSSVGTNPTGTTIGSTASINNPRVMSTNPISSNHCASRCSCACNQALADLTHRFIPDLAFLSYQQRVPVLPLVNLGPRRVPPPAPAANHRNSSAAEKALYNHMPVPGCCQKDSYLTLAIELALIALGQQRSLPLITTAHERSIRQEAELISKLKSTDMSDPVLVEIIKHQSTVLLEGGPFQNSCCGIPTDCAPLHTFATFLFDSLVTHHPQLAYKVGIYALKMALSTEENSENFVAARGPQISVNNNHLQSEQLALAQTMLSKAKDEGPHGSFLRKVYRASIKNIRNPSSLLKLARHVLKEAKPNSNCTTLFPALLRTAYDLGLQVLKMTISPHTSNGKTRREAINFIVECSTDIGPEAVYQVMRESREYFSATEALNLVVARDSDHINLRTQASNKLKLKDNLGREEELNRRSRELVLDCADRDPSNCALEALKFCETNDDSLKKALDIVIDAGAKGLMDSSQLIKVADHIEHSRGLTDKAFDIAMVAVESFSIPLNSDNSSSKKDLISACEYAKKVGRFSMLIPKLINNIECATVLSEIYLQFHPSNQTSNYGRTPYANDVMAATYRLNLNYGNKADYTMLAGLGTDMYQRSLEDAKWWDALLKRTLKAFVDTTRTRLQNISPRHYEEFIDFLEKAQGTFEKAVDGPQQFKKLISEIIKSYKTKKKLIEKLKSRFDSNSIRTRA